MSTYIDGIHLDDEEQELLALLKSIPVGCSLTDIEISSRLSWWVPQVFGVSASLLSKGLPVCFSSSTGWHDPASPDRARFWHTNDAKDLDVMVRMIRQESEDLEEMLEGCEAVRQRLTTNGVSSEGRHVRLEL